MQQSHLEECNQDKIPDIAIYGDKFWQLFSRKQNLICHANITSRFDGFCELLLCEKKYFVEPGKDVWTVNSPHFKLVVARLLDQTLIVSAVTRVFEVSRSEGTFLEKNIGGD